MQIDRLNISVDVGFTVYRFGKGFPCVSIVSGLSKSDGCGVAVLKKVVEELKSKSVYGTAIIIPQFIEPVCVPNIDRYGGAVNVLDRLIEKFAEVTPKDCLVIVLKCGKGVAPHIVMAEEHADDRLKLLDEAMPVEYVVKAVPKGFSKAIKEKGYAVVTAVIKGGREFEPSDVDRGLGIIMDTLANLGLLKRKARKVQHMYFNGYHRIRCLSAGIFSPTAAIGSEISSGTVIGSIDGNEIASPVDGVILYISPPKLCCINEVVCVIALKG